jgi:hypothetical protein
LAIAARRNFKSLAVNSKTSMALTSSLDVHLSLSIFVLPRREAASKLLSSGLTALDAISARFAAIE